MRQVTSWPPWQFRINLVHSFRTFITQIPYSINKIWSIINKEAWFSDWALVLLKNVGRDRRGKGTTLYWKPFRIIDWSLFVRDGMCGWPPTQESWCEKKSLWCLVPCSNLRLIEEKFLRLIEKKNTPGTCSHSWRILCSLFICLCYSDRPKQCFTVLSKPNRISQSMFCFPNRNQTEQNM